MSAQIITALRVRAEMLSGEADRLDAMGLSEVPDTGHRDDQGRSVRNLRFLAAEFRGLADQAEQLPR